MTKNMDGAGICGLMAEFMRGSGSGVNNMDLEFTSKNNSQAVGREKLVKIYEKLLS